MDILQYINKMNRLYGNDSTPVRFNTRQYLQGGRVGYQSGQLVQPGPGRPGYAGDEAALKKYLKNYKEKSFDRTAAAKKFGYKDKDVVYRAVKEIGREDLLELPFRKGAAKALEYLKKQPKGSSIQVNQLAKKLKVANGTIERALNQLPEKKFITSKFKPSVLTNEEFTKLYKDKKMSDKEFANYLNKETKKTTATGGKFDADTVFARRDRLKLKSQHPNPVVAGASDLFIKNEAKRFNINTKGVSKEELRRKVLSRRGDEQKNLKMATNPEYLERQRMFRKRALANIKADPERLAAYKKRLAGYASKRIWGLVPVDKTPKGYLWRDLIDNSLRFQNKQLPNSHIQFLNPQEKRPTSISAAKDVKLIDLNILDKKGKPKILTYDTILKHVDNNSKRYGMSSKDLLKEYEKKLFIQQNPDVRDQLNKKLYKRYDPTKVSSRAVLSPFHIHHTAGRGKNAFNIQLGSGAENMAENALRRRFDTDFKVAKTLTDKKNAMKKYINKVSDTLEVRIKNVPYGTRPTLMEQIKTIGGKGLKMSPEARSQAMALHSFPANLQDPKFLAKEAIEGGKLVGKGFGKTFRTLGTPIAGPAFAAWTASDKMKAGESLADAVIDPLTGAELALPTMFKENLSKIAKSPTARKILGLGKFGTRFLGPIGWGIAGVGAVRDAYKDYQRRKPYIEKIKEQRRKGEIAEEQFDEDFTTY